MTGSPSNLQDVRGFTRGFLLAMDWAGQAGDAEITNRVPSLGDEDMNGLYRAFRALPPESRRAMRTTWAKRDRLRRIDEAVDLHPSWMVEALEHEPPPLFLMALGELEPGLARNVLRELWPKMRPRPEQAVGDVRPLTPAHAGAFRRFLYSRWVHLAEGGGRSPALAPLLDLGAGPLWLLAQEFGRREIEGSASRLGPDHPSPRVRAAYAAGTDENDRVGLVGLHLFSSLLSKHPRHYALHLAQRMSVQVAKPFLRWRDEGAAHPQGGTRENMENGGPNPEPCSEGSPCPSEEILARARILNANREGDGE